MLIDEPSPNPQVQQLLKAIRQLSQQVKRGLTRNELCQLISINNSNGGYS